ncbi:MAG: aminotransferase class IV [Anaerolineae bacterium]|nr:aminotransferase class IV [Anaerolineae bacterium]MDQ7036935.1 aminotransferase class IV [Anaerolineae bacterium]
MSIFYINGDYVAEENAVLNARDLSILRGYGAFDFLRTYGRQPFRLDKNIARLRRSCGLLELDLVWSDEEIADIVLETLRRNAHVSSDFNIRLVVTGGISNDNLIPDSEPSLLVLVQPIKAPPAIWYERGVKVITVANDRLVPEAKSIMYTPAIIAQKRARKVGGIEALYKDDDDNVLEGTTVNIFAFMGNTLITPPTDGRILPGITRMTVLEMAQEYYTIEERDLPYHELLAADEIFMTAANKQIVPVVTVDDHTIASGTVGEGTQHIMALFAEITAKRAAGLVV